MARKPKSPKNGLRPKPAVKEISRVILFLVDGIPQWVASTEPEPRGKMVAKLGERITQDSGLGAETRIEWNIPPADHPRWVTRTAWIERRSKRHAVGRHGADDDGQEWVHPFTARWRRGQYEDDSAPGTEGEIQFATLNPWRLRHCSKWEVCDETPAPASWSPHDFPPVDTGPPFRELWWARDGTGLSRSRVKPAGEFFAEVRYFRAGEHAFVRQDVMRLPAAAPAPSLDEDLHRTAEFLSKEPWPELMADHPESSETHMRSIRNPAWNRRADAVSGLLGLARELKSGTDTERLVRLAIQAGIDLARAGQEELVPAIEHGRSIRAGGGGRPALRGADSLWAAVNGFVDAVLAKRANYSASQILRALNDEIRTRGGAFPIGFSPGGGNDSYTRTDVLTNDPEWSRRTMLTRIHEMVSARRGESEKGPVDK